MAFDNFMCLQGYSSINHQCQILWAFGEYIAGVEGNPKLLVSAQIRPKIDWVSHYHYHHNSVLISSRSEIDKQGRKINFSRRG